MSYRCTFRRDTFSYEMCNETVTHVAPRTEQLHACNRHALEMIRFDWRPLDWPACDLCGRKAVYRADPWHVCGRCQRMVKLLEDSKFVRLSTKKPLIGPEQGTTGLQLAAVAPCSGSPEPTRKDARAAGVTGRLGQ